MGKEISKERVWTRPTQTIYMFRAESTRIPGGRKRLESLTCFLLSLSHGPGHGIDGCMDLLYSSRDRKTANRRADLEAVALGLGSGDAAFSIECCSGRASGVPVSLAGVVNHDETGGTRWRALGKTVVAVEAGSWGIGGSLGADTVRAIEGGTRRASRFVLSHAVVADESVSRRAAGGIGRETLGSIE